MSKEVDSPEPKRGYWGRQLEFTFSIIGYSVGLANFWRFPYLCMRNGGGAFLIPYFTFLLFAGIPLYFIELCIGQFSGCSVIIAWRKICPLFKGIGWGMVIVSGICTIYYITLMVWILYYLVMSCRKEVPWQSCDNDWNTVNCTVLGFAYHDPNVSYARHNTTVIYSSLNDGTTQSNLSNPALMAMGRGNDTTELVSAAEEFWRYKVLGISNGIDEIGGLKWDLVLCLIAVWLVVYLCICKGIKTSGKIVYATVIIPYALLTVLLIRGATLPGSYKGIQFYIIPKWERLSDFQVWTDACLQVFYSLGPSWGGLITMASYNRFNNNCLSDALVASMTCGLSSLYSGFVIFTILGYMAHATGLDVEDVVTQGPGLAFVVYPEALSKLPIPQFWAICFFLTLLCLAIDGQFGMLETVISGLIDEFPQFGGRRRRIFTGVVISCIMFLIGLPYVTRGGMYLFQIADWYSGAFSCMIMGFLELFVISYIYGIGNFYRDVNMMLKRKLHYWWAVCWCGVTQFILLSLLVLSAVKMTPPTYGSYEYPKWAIGMGWILAMISIIPIPLAALWQLARAKGTLSDRLSSFLRPTADWGPQEPELKLAYSSHWRSSLTPRQKMSLRSNPRLASDGFVHSENKPLNEKELLKLSAI